VTSGVGQSARFTVVLNRNIGPPEVTIQALLSGRLGMYPEYLRTWNSTIAGNERRFTSVRAAYRAAQGYARAHGLALLDRTPFSDTDAICVTSSYAAQNGLRTIGDLGNVSQTLTLGAPPQFQQTADDLPALEQAYGFYPAAFRALELGGQYQALERGLVQAADVNTTDGQLLARSYRLLADPKGVFGSGNVTPVVSLSTLASEGPAFAATINRVSRLLTLAAMRQLNAAVDVSHQDPATVARQFLAAHRLLTANGG